MSNITKRIIKGVLVLLIFSKDVPVIAQQTWKAQLLNYLNTKLAKKDGGYGWEDQPDSHITPTYAVIGILNDIDQLPPDISNNYLLRHRSWLSSKLFQALLPFRQFLILRVQPKVLQALALYLPTSIVYEYSLLCRGVLHQMCL